MHLTCDLAEIKLVNIVKEYENPDFDLDQKIKSLAKVINKLKKTLVYLNEQNMKKTTFIEQYDLKNMDVRNKSKDSSPKNRKNGQNFGKNMGSNFDFDMRGSSLNHVEVYLRCLIIIGSYSTFLNHVNYSDENHGYNLSIYTNYISNLQIHEKELNPILVSQFYTFVLLRILSEYFLKRKPDTKIPDSDNDQNDPHFHKFYNVAKTFYKWF